LAMAGVDGSVPGRLAGAMLLNVGDCVWLAESSTADTSLCTGWAGATWGDAVEEARDARAE
jgi:hypothetical protein